MAGPVFRHGPFLDRQYTRPDAGHKEQVPKGQRQAAALRQVPAGRLMDATEWADRADTVSGDRPRLTCALPAPIIWRVWRRVVGAAVTG